MSDAPFRLFASCVPVRGARRSVICDLQRQTYHLIPNGLYDILTENRGQTLAEIKADYEHEFDDVIDEYFEYLVGLDLGFWCDEPERFPDLDLTWRAPERITNAIVDVDDHSRHDFARILEQLDDLGCKALEVRFFGGAEPAAIEAVLAASRHGRLQSIELLLPHGPAFTEDWLVGLCREHQRLARVIVHSAPENRDIEVPGLSSSVVCKRQVIDSPRCCGQVHPGYFAPNLGLFTEAQRHNSCLNRKLSIDARGEIKNCPSMTRSFGNVRDTTLHGALLQRDFRELWTINKDQVEVCRDCEFRYICVDCRAYIANPDDRYSKPAKCGYDPYTAEWRSPSST